MADIEPTPATPSVIRKLRPWLLSLLGGGSLMLFSAYQDRAQRKGFENPTPSVATESAALGIAAPAPQPAAGKPSVPLNLYEDDEEGEGGEDDEEGERRGRVPSPQPSVAPIPSPQTASPAPQPSRTAPAPAPVAGGYRDGSYRASSYTEWGSMSIEVTVANGRWTDVKLLSVPNSSPSRFAVTYLVQQALVAQSDAIDGVTGATYTSDAFRDDLRQIISLSRT